MTTVALDIVINSQGATAGAQQIDEALKKVQQSAKQTEDAMKRVAGGSGTGLPASSPFTPSSPFGPTPSSPGVPPSPSPSPYDPSRQTLNNIFAGTGGTVQIAQGIAQTSKALGELNVQAALFSSSRTLIEVGRTAGDFIRLSESIGMSSGALGALSKAFGPIAIATTVIGSIVSIMALFASNTTKAAASFDQLASSMKKATLDERTARFLGGAGTGSRLEALSAATASALESGQGLTVDKTATVSGLGRADVLRYLAQNGDSEAQQYMRTGLPPQRRGGRFDLLRPIDVGRDLSLTGPQLQDLLRLQYRSVADDQRQYNQRLPGLGPYFPNAERSPFTDIGLGGQPGFERNAFRQNYVEQGVDDRAQTAIEHSIVMSEKVAKNMEAAARFAGTIGASFGDAAADVVLAGAGLKQAVTGLLQQFARQGLREGFAGIFSAAAKGFGATAPQTTPQVPVGGGP